MEFGLFVQAHVPRHEVDRNPEGAEHQRLMNELELAVHCDEVGWKYIWSVEHHFLEEYSHIKDTIKHAEPVGDFVNDNVACVSMLLCLEDRKRARQLAMNMGNNYHNSLVFRYLDTFPRPANVPAWPAVIPEPSPEELEDRIEKGIRLIGDPDEVRKGVQKYVDIGCDQLIFGVLASTQPMDIAKQSTELFAKQVMPHFDKDPVHSTTRQRESALGAKHGRGASAAL